MSEWIPLSSVGNWTQAIGRLARAGDGTVGTVLYFVFGDPIRVTIQSGRGLITVLASECQVLTREEEELSDRKPV
jgi:hypothetical protein